MNSAGRHGQFAIDVEAHGDGPIPFGAMATKKFRWSRSLAVMLRGLLPRHLGRLNGALRVRFAFAQPYYPLLALTAVAGLTLPPVACLPWINVNHLSLMGHCWALSVWVIVRKAVGESAGIPIAYYDIDVGDPAAPTNPYATTKWICEQGLADMCRRLPGRRLPAQRYFNPAGAHCSGQPRGNPDNIMPYPAQVAVGCRERLSVFGAGCPTPDGTGIRDCIHLVDVAEGHRRGLDHSRGGTGMRVFTPGTGVGSVLDLVPAFERASGRPIPYEVTGRRAGDVAELVADPGAVAAARGWIARRDLAGMCEDAWRFQRLNPSGYVAG